MSSDAISAGDTGSPSRLDALARPGWLTFAAVVLYAVAILRLISAIYYFADSNRVNNITFGAFGHHLFIWGLWDLLIAVLAGWAGWSLMNGETFGRIIAYVWAVAVIVESLTMISYSPWYGFAAMFLAVVVMYAVSSTRAWSDPASSVS
jgi:hypothetical protein